jgi:hypothetical protein
MSVKLGIPYSSIVYRSAARIASAVRAGGQSSWVGAGVIMIDDTFGEKELPL